MKFPHLIIEALESLSSNKLRSALTILGIVIGVAAVIAMVSLGRGVQASVNDQFAGVGTTQITVFSGGDEGVLNPKPLTLADAEALIDPVNAPNIVDVAAITQGSANLSFGSENVAGTIYGVTANYGSINNYTMLEGKFFGEEQVLGQSAVVVLGARMSKILFGRTSGVVDELIRINGQPFRVMGVIEERGAGGITITQIDNAAVIPVSTAQMRLIQRPTRGQVDMLTVQVNSADNIASTTDDLTQILHTRHNAPVGLNDFSVFEAKSVVDALNQVTGALTLFLGAIAAISLLVGGIGIMNIMLVSVTERTREIGLRKALGARRRDILVQFLVESASLSLVGGILGILLGVLIGVIIKMASASSGSPINPVVGLDAILLATLTSSAIGIFFGFYPANRAARLQPVEALRSE